MGPNAVTAKVPSNAMSPQFEFADELQRASRHCATIGRAQLGRFFERGLVPRRGDATATVSFIRFEGKTYAVTAKHVIETFLRQARLENAGPEPFSVPSGIGALIQPPFIFPLGRHGESDPDIALREVQHDFPAHVGKIAFEFNREPRPAYPIKFAVAVGFPTLAKIERLDGRIAMPCVHAIAEGLSAPEHADQIQFFSEIERAPEIISLSGMSGGLSLWSTPDRLGLLGFVKEALDVAPAEGVESIYAGPRVNFIVQHATYERFGHWAEYAQQEWPRQRAALNDAVDGE